MSQTPDRPAARRRRSARREQGPAAQVPVDDSSAPPAETPAEDRSPQSRKRARRRTPAASPMPVRADRPADPSAAPPTAGGPKDRRVDHAERALRGLVTTHGTQVSWSAATRAREVAMPSAADLAAAAAEVVIVRRNYTPPQPLRTARTGDGPRPRRRPG
jgi:hypothetical protein